MALFKYHILLKRIFIVTLFHLHIIKIDHIN